ncbi:MAG: PDZ domain-containing protein [Phycisphaerae bacterium]
MKKLLIAMTMLTMVVLPAWLSADGSADAQDPNTAMSTPDANASADDANEPLFPEATLTAARRSLVIVRTWFKKDVTETPSEVEDNYQLSEIYEEYIEKKRPRETSGVVIDKGRILVYDDGIEPRFIDRVEVETVAGEKIPATRSRLLSNVTAIELVVPEKHASKLTPLAFAPLSRGLNSSLSEAGLLQEEDQWRIRKHPLSPSVRFARGEIDNVFYGYRGYRSRYRGMNTTEPGIVCRKDGKPVGCSLGRFFDVKQTDCLWKGPDLIKAKGIATAELAKKEESIRGKLDDSLYEIIITFRGESGSGRYGYGSSAAGREVPVFAVAISDKHIFVPIPLDRKTADRIDKLYIKHSPSKRERVAFAGAYKDFTGFVVTVRKGKLPAHIKPAKSNHPPMKPFWEGSMRRKFGRKYLELSTNRLIGKSRGYEGKYHWEAVRGIGRGSVLLNFDGELVGMYLRQRVEDEEAKKLERSDSYYDQTPTETRVFTISELRDALKSPEKYMDPTIKIRPRTLAKRRAWFGVEYVPMNKELAEQFKVETPTKDGQIGFVVNVVYPDSPADKMGIEPGDILLRAQSAGMPYPFEFQARLAGGNDYDYPWHRRRGGEGELGPAASIWKDRQNFLTRAMDAIGVGKNVVLWVQDRNGKDAGEIRKTNYKIELAPPDQDSAQKWQNRKLGITVRNLTYEVRYALNRKPSDPGVLVAKVESGSPTLVARIFPNEVITQLDDTPVKSAKHLRDLVAKAKENGLEKVRLTILRLGKTRFADLQITEYDPADDEGLDEEDDQ